MKIKEKYFESKMLVIRKVLECFSTPRKDEALFTNLESDTRHYHSSYQLGEVTSKKFHQRSSRSCKKTGIFISYFFLVWENHGNYKAEAITSCDKVLKIDVFRKKSIVS